MTRWYGEMDEETPDWLADLREMTAKVNGTPDRAGKVGIVAGLMADGPRLAGLRSLLAADPGPVEAELARLGAVAGLSGIVKTLRKMLVVPVRLAGPEEEEERVEGEPISLRVALDRDDVPALVVPSTWEVSPSGLWRLREGPDGVITERVSHQPLFITSRFLDLDTELVSLALSWVLPSGRLREVIVDRARVMDGRELVKLASLGAPVNSAVASMLVRWLADLEGVNARLLPSGWASARCGWLGKRMQYYLAGADLLSAGEPAHDVRLLATDGGAQLLGHIKPAGTWEGWCEAFEKVAGYPLVVIAVYGACAGPLLRILECDNFILDYYGRSGRGKTSSLRMGMSCWGMPEEGAGLIRSWSATATGAERVAVALSDMAMALDDTAKVPDKDKNKIAGTLYMIANGSGKVRGKVQGLDQVASWHTVCISTGEASATSFTQDEGVQARCLSLSGHPLGEDGAARAEELRRTLTRNHGHAGPRLVKWLLENREKWDWLRAQYQERIEKWGAHASNGMARRCCKYIAALEIAAGILHDQLGVPAVTVDPFADLFGRVQTTTQEADKAAAAFMSAYSWACASRAALWSLGKGDKDQPPGGWLGRWDRVPDPTYSGEDPQRALWIDDPKMVYVLPDPLHALLSRLGYQPAAMIAEWAERGWLKRQRNERTWRTRIAGSPTPLSVYALILDHLHAGEASEIA